MTRDRHVTFLAGAAAVALAFAAWGGVSESATAAPTTAAAHRATIRAATEGGLGKIVVDSRGRTLYLFKKDRGTRSACAGQCASNWPPVRVSGKPTVAGGLKASKVGTTKRSDGTRQVTYNGHPLYRFIGDAKAGDTNGQGLKAFGARWYVLSRAGRQVTRSGSPSGSSPSSSGGGGY